MRKSNMVACCALLLVILVPYLNTSAAAAHFDKSTSSRQARVHYSNPGSTSDVVVLAVGTSMSITDYDNLAGAIADYGYIVVIMDHVRGNMVKTDATKLRNTLLWVKSNLKGWLSGTGCKNLGLWVVGGHSCGGQAAQQAISSDSSLADAIFSIDPYNCNSVGYVNLPAMYWGFNVSTCFVGKDDAAKAAYYHSTNRRAFYRVAKKYTWGPCGYSPKFFHCSFGDNHCLACTNCMFTPGYFFDDVARSVDKFIGCLLNGNWSKSNLQISHQTPLTLFEGNDSP